MPRSPSCPPGADTSAIVTAVVFAPLDGSIRIIRLPVRSVTHNMLSGPQVISQGPASPETSTRFSKRFVPFCTDSGPSCAVTRVSRKVAVTNRAAARAKCFIQKTRFFAAYTTDYLESRVDRFTLKREHPEDTLVYAAQRLAGDEALQRLNPEGKFASSERSLASQCALPQARQLIRSGVFGAVDNPQVLSAAALQRRLHVTFRTVRKKFERLYHHSLATVSR